MAGRDVNGARFSQFEEKAADDYGLSFLVSRGSATADAVAALGKLASQGGAHAFLAGHPDPEVRARGSAGRLRARSFPLEKPADFMSRIKAKLAEWFLQVFSNPGQN